MKTIYCVLLICLVSFSALAQEETLIGESIESGGFGGPVVKFGSINGSSGILVGGRGGWIINHAYILGGGGYGLANNVKAKTLGPNDERYLNFGYGGLELEYVSDSDRLIHYSFMTLIGAGGVGWRDDNIRTGSNGDDASFFILEPAANVTLNVSKFFRISAGVSYRYITGTESAAASNADLSGPSAVLTLRFGQF
jgi:hypothetical protein